MTEKLGMLEAARLTISIAAPAARMVLSISPVEQPGREHLSIDVALIETETVPERSKPRGDEPPGPAHCDDAHDAVRGAPQWVSTNTRSGFAVCAAPGGRS